MVDLTPYLDTKTFSAERYASTRANANIIRAMEGVLALLPETINGDVLDIGPGCGWEIAELETRYPGHRVDVVTLHEVEAAVLQELARDEVHVLDMHDLPDEWSDRFGLVFASFVLDHSPAPYIALCEWARVLKPGGELFLSLPDPGGYTGLGNNWPARMGSFLEHLFSPSFETMLEMIRHIPGDHPIRCGLGVLDFVSYHEVPHVSGQRVHYWRRVWRVRKSCR